ncbi:MAG: hypothetical protein K6U14_04695 [Firmicutes bacterium]|nr:hypothetical protein [Alicyclobacillaceae bacterium]MCL6496918.1 hypothetical protein [Bacillota bacterium]
MALSPAQVWLYAADPVDYGAALAVASLVNLSPSQVTTDFVTACQKVAQGDGLLIAVGAPAAAALTSNPCQWPLPRGVEAAFHAIPGPSEALPPPAGTFWNGAGIDRFATLLRTAGLAAAALGRVLPELPPLPSAVAPAAACAPSALSKIPCPCALPVPPNAEGVGLYAAFGSPAAVTQAITLGWPGVAATAGLGTPQSPYTAALDPNPDAYIAQALAQTSGPLPFWVSFWTVSGPAGGDSFEAAGYRAGQVAAETVLQYPGPWRPNYLVLDPEGFNALPATQSQWSAWLWGWAEGIWSVDTRLQPAFYATQSQYQSGNLAQVALPAIVAVSPIPGNTPIVSGPNLLGFHGFYAGCPAEGAVSQVAAWGGRLNLVQFPDSGVDCGP